MLVCGSPQQLCSCCWRYWHWPCCCCCCCRRLAGSTRETVCPVSERDRISRIFLSLLSRYLQRLRRHKRRREAKQQLLELQQESSSCSSSCSSRSSSSSRTPAGATSPRPAGSYKNIIGLENPKISSAAAAAVAATAAAAAAAATTAGEGDSAPL